MVTKLAKGKSGNGLTQLPSGDWRARAFSPYLEGREVQATFQLKADALSWKIELQRSLRELHEEHPESRVRYVKRRKIWECYLPAGNYAGNQYADYVRPFGSIQKALAEEIRVLAERNTGVHTSDEIQQRTLSMVLDEWLIKHEKKVRWSTYAKDLGLIENHIRPQLGEIKCTAIDIYLLEIWQETLEESDVSNNTIRSSIHKLRQVLTWALPRRYVSHNAAQGIVAPTSPRKTWKPLTTAQVSEVCKLSKSPGVIMTLVYTALRVSEALALQVKHVNFDTKMLSVEQHHALTRDGIKIVSGTKTHQRREIPIIDDLIPILGAQVLGKTSEDFLFTGVVSTHMPQNANSFRRHRLKPAMDKIGVDGSFHLFRKTSACLLLERGIKIESISKILGHSNITTTYNFYLDIYEEDVANELSVLNNLFAESTGDPLAKEALKKKTSLAA
jgi:integrase